MAWTRHLTVTAAKLGHSAFYYRLEAGLSYTGMGLWRHCRNNSRGGSRSKFPIRNLAEKGQGQNAFGTASFDLPCAQCSVCPI